MTMEREDVVTAVACLEPPFPRAAAEEARRRWDEWAPRFIAEIARVADGGSICGDGAEDENEGLFGFATYLAAEKRDTRAYAPLVRACHCTAEDAEERFSDDIGETLGRLLASVCDGDLAPLKALAEDAGAAMWCRYAALHAMVVRVVEGDDSRDELLAYLEMLCMREAEVIRRGEWDYACEPNDLLSWAADTACDIGPAPLMERIRGWFEEGLIDPAVSGLQWFEKHSALPAARCLAEAAENEGNRYVTDAVAMFAAWACFDDSVHASPPPWAAQAGIKSTVVREMPKVGRNDPCPCGSGKKFKKCCGKTGDEPANDSDSATAVCRALDWLHERHRKATAAAIEDMLMLSLDEDAEDELRNLDEETWQSIQINASEWLIAEGEIRIKGEYRSVPELLLGPGGPNLSAGQRHWIEQLATRPLHLYDITEVVPGERITLCDALDTEAAPAVVFEQSGSLFAQVGSRIGARIMEVGGHFELSGAAYPFSRLADAALMADLLAQLAECERRGDDMRRTASFVIREHWLAQYVKPLPLPDFVDTHSGEPLLFVTDHYRVKDWDALARVLATAADIEGDRESGWSRIRDCEDGMRRPIASINRGKKADRIEIFYKTQAYADAGRTWFEALAGDAATFTGRGISDPKGLMKNLPSGKESTANAGPDLSPDVMADAIEQVLRRSYANWADEPIPALGDKTPRQAIATPAGLERVKGLLRGYESGEKEQATRQGRREISYAFLWDALGLR